MSSSRAWLKRAAAEWLVAAAVVGGVPALAQAGHPTDPALSEIEGVTLQGPLTPQAEEAAFKTALRASDGNTAQLLGLGLGTWPLPGHRHEEALALQIPLALQVFFPPPGTALAHIEGGLDTQPVFPPQYRNPFIRNYDRIEKKAFAEPKAEVALFPVDGADNLRSDTAYMGSVAFLASVQEWNKLRTRIAPSAAANIGETKEFGFGPAMEKLMASKETKAETAARHQLLFELAEGKPGVEAVELSRLLYGNLAAFIYEVERAGLYRQQWKKGAPADRLGIEAAVYDALGQPPLKGDDKKQPLFENHAAKVALRDFPAAPLDAGKSTAAALQEGGFAADPRFYKEVVPELYREVLQVLGDPDASREMNLPAENVYGASFLFHLIHNSDGPPQTWDYPTWKEIAAKVEPESFQTVVEEAVFHNNAAALMALLLTPNERLLTAEDKARYLNQAELNIVRLTDNDRLEARSIVSILVQVGANANDLPPSIVPGFPEPSGTPEKEGEDFSRDRSSLMQIKLNRAPAGAIQKADSHTPQR